ncbi:uncharacterized protein B0I36DRAFT_239910 [Microdochium trichocladiopsis]|uniref:RING-type domain-containing protein n=1 Tax=Microdochium trichocladiopsis TaxID=1682393 RepID=A0A9P9BTN6_9PEZI|nr:uncharacterized protein B0I36DRAFT_239910 [Microdochium trichocladiopsis]KAH7035672.1 hypothetical protein B0I36DRAFT_239910 [Microdochium trichocladiopsis]
MEHILRCNALKCRKQLGDKAVVTTCRQVSDNDQQGFHIFCPDCAARLGLAGGRQDHRPSCPACSSPLTHPDDAVVTLLNPSEDYKTSVLSGLTPHTIIETASRGLSFWAYQTTQEVVYQEHLSKKLTEKYTDLNHHLERIINEANSQIANLQGKIHGIAMDHEVLQKKNEEIAQAYKDKTRKLLQIQELYDKLKQKTMLGQVQGAAEDAADSTIHGTHSASFDMSTLAPSHLYEHAPQEIIRQSAWQPHMMPPPPPPAHSRRIPAPSQTGHCKNELVMIAN